MAFEKNIYLSTDIRKKAYSKKIKLNTIFELPYVGG